MTREPLMHTPAQDPGRPNMGSADWWRRNVPKQPDWWSRVFSEPFYAQDYVPTPLGQVSENCAEGKDG